MKIQMKRLVYILMMMAPFIGLGQWGLNLPTMSDFTYTVSKHPTLLNVLNYKIINTSGTPKTVGIHIRLDNAATIGYIPQTPINGGAHKIIPAQFNGGGVFAIEILFFDDNGWLGKISIPKQIVISGNGEYGCCSMTLNAENTSVEGDFQLDKATGKIVFTGNMCGTVEVFDCVSLNRSGPDQIVVSANAQTYESWWDYPVWRYGDPTANANSIELGNLNKWRVRNTYTYKSELDEHLNASVNSEYKNYDRGAYRYKQFLWRDEGANDFDQWIKTSAIISYSPNGQPTMERNALNVLSSAIFGYNNTQMVGVAQNAGDFEISFTSFENLNGTSFDNDVQYVVANSTYEPTKSHTGSSSLKVKNSAYVNVGPSGNNNGLWVVPHNAEDGMLIQVWVKYEGNVEPTLRAKLEKTASVYCTKPMEIAQRCGEWVLYEAELNKAELTVSGSDVTNAQCKVLIESTNFASTNAFYIDDARIQPLRSEMVTYVYDENLRLVANFDSQHFALIYQYNAEGKLIRKLKETKEGIITLSETQYNSVGVQRD